MCERRSPARRCARQSRSPAGAQPLFDLQKVADGVYAALATPRSPINCNAAVVVLDDAVLVVDTHSRPSSAKALIAQIRTITDKPVRFAVNTHFHWDHAQGNHAYPVAFPKQVAIVASEATRENLRTLGGARLKDQLANTPGQIAALEAQLAKATDAAAQARLKDEIAQQKDYLAEIKSLELTLPDLTFDKSLIIHRGDRRIVLLFLGRGHTDGDIVAWLPKERVIATGDLLHGWMPYMGDSYPPEWVATLDALGKLEFDHIIGGHGTVKPRAHLTFFRNYLADLIAAVRTARDRGETLDQAKGLGVRRPEAEVRRRHGWPVRRARSATTSKRSTATSTRRSTDDRNENTMRCAHRSFTLLLGLAALLSVLAFVVPLAAQSGAGGTLVFIGTYASPASKGIYVSRLDPATGALSAPTLAAEIRNPSFLAATADGRFLYAVSEVDAVAGTPGGAVAGYAIDKAAGTLKALNSQSTVGGGPAHVSVAGKHGVRRQLRRRQHRRLSDGGRRHAEAGVVVRAAQGLERGSEPAEGAARARRHARSVGEVPLRSRPRPRSGARSIASTPRPGRSRRRRRRSPRSRRPAPAHGTSRSPATASTPT